MTTKPSNPKDRCGVNKAPLSYVSMPVMFEVGLGMLEGGYEYGRHNYRVVGVREASVKSWRTRREKYGPSGRAV